MEENETKNSSSPQEASQEPSPQKGAGGPSSFYQEFLQKNNAEEEESSKETRQHSIEAKLKQWRQEEEERQKKTEEKLRKELEESMQKEQATRNAPSTDRTVKNSQELQSELEAWRHSYEEKHGAEEQKKRKQLEVKLSVWRKMEAEKQKRREQQKRKEIEAEVARVEKAATRKIRKEKINKMLSGLLTMFTTWKEKRRGSREKKRQEKVGKKQQQESAPREKVEDTKPEKLYQDRQKEIHTQLRERRRALSPIAKALEPAPPLREETFYAGIRRRSRPTPLLTEEEQRAEDRKALKLERQAAHVRLFYYTLRLIGEVIRPLLFIAIGILLYRSFITSSSILFFPLIHQELKGTAKILIGIFILLFLVARLFKSITGRSYEIWGKVALIVGVVVAAGFLIHTSGASFSLAQNLNNVGAQAYHYLSDTWQKVIPKIIEVREIPEDTSLNTPK